LLASLVDTTGEPAQLWFTRFWTAKEAVAKAEGPALAAHREKFVVTRVTGDDLEVSVAGRHTGCGVRRSATRRFPGPGVRRDVDDR